jgi:general secretion pathway protein M
VSGAATTAATHPLRARWNTLAAREQALVAAAALLVAAALLWLVALGPALATLRSAEARHRTLDAQLQQVQRLQAEAQALQQRPRANRSESLRALQAGVAERLGAAARVQVLGDRATVTLQDVAPDTLAGWLAQVRDARALPVEARLARNAAGRWGGTVTVALPPG